MTKPTPTARRLIDRDFTYLELLQYWVNAGINFVIPLNMRSLSELKSEAESYFKA